MGKEISDIETEKSQEASACNRYYSDAIESTLSDAWWPFATRIKALELIETNPNNEWNYSYRYPSDCLTLRKIQSGIRNDTHESRVPYLIASDDAGRIVFTDQQNAICEYTKNISDVSLFNAEFRLAVSFRLAAYIAPRLTNGDPFSLRDKAMNAYYAEVSRAKANFLNEASPGVLPESQFINIRE